MRALEKLSDFCLRNRAKCAGRDKIVNKKDTVQLGGFFGGDDLGRRDISRVNPCDARFTSRCRMSVNHDAN